MTTFKLLVPIDFSDNATNALDFACRLALEIPCELTVFHSYPLQPKNPFMNLEEILALEKQEEAKAQEKLHEFINFFRSRTPFFDQIKINFLTRLGFAVENVISLTENKNFDLIVMGTKGAGNVKTKLLGTNTAVVMDNVSCPVLAVPAEATWNSIHKIVLATDLSDFRFEEAQTLIAIARVFKAQLILVHIHHSKSEKRRFDVDSFLHLAKTDLQYDDIIVVEMMDDALQDQLNQFVKSQGANILAMTIKHRSFFQKIFYPDISRELFYQSQVPLLALHAEDQQTGR